MDFVGIFLVGFFVLAIVFGPIFGAESRPEFLRPDLRQRHRWDGPLKGFSRFH